MHRTEALLCSGNNSGLPMDFYLQSANYKEDAVPAGLNAFFEDIHDNEHTGDGQEPPKKRQKLSYTQSLTPPDSDVSGHESKGANLKLVNDRLREKNKARYVLSFPKDFFTLARVDIDVAFPASVPSHSVTTNDLGLPVLLKRFQSQDGTFICCLKDIEHGTTFEFEGQSSIGPETVEVLRQIIKTSGNEKEMKVHSICLLSKIPGLEEASGKHYQLCCKLLIKYASHLGDGLPIKKLNPFDTYGLEQPSPTYGTWSPKDFYENVHIPVKCNECPEDPTLDPLKKELKCQLYPFQKRAVTWLLYREGIGVAGQGTKPSSTGTELPHGFKRTTDADGKQALVSRCLNIAIKDEKQLGEYISDVKGGILSEEMGLGKTVELIALMCLHRWDEPSSIPRTTPPDDELKRSRATVIITPPAILLQWENELQILAPHLKVVIYGGVKKDGKGRDNEALVAQLADQDVILTTYNVLAREVHYTAAAVPSRDMRHEKRYEQKKSPLTQILWWRVVLDEAQMIESGVSNAAKVAQQLPRKHAWAVSGTPVKKDSKDLLGLLIFLDYQPYSASLKLWERMIKDHRNVFGEIFRNLALRHTKDQIKDELQLPPQTRMIINVPFTQIEEQHYSDMYQAMCDDCGLDLDGAPVKEDWDPNSPMVVEKMRMWLARLRQTCLHPQVGRKNRKALGPNKGPLRTVEEVLGVMTEQNETASRAEERALMLSRIRRGQILEHAKRTHEALRIWKDALEEAKVIVAEGRQSLSSETVKLGLTDEAMHLEDGSEAGDSPAARTGFYRHRLRFALELEHMCTFFVANAYYQIKSNPELTEPESAAYKELEKAEEDTYEVAKLLRKEILVEALHQTNTWMSKIRAKATDGDVVRIPSIKRFKDQGGIESRDLPARLDNLRNLLNFQKTHLEDWRQKLMELVLLPLVDEENTDLQGDEYETSTKQQDEVYVYMDALRAIVADRQDTLLGQTNTRIDNEMKAAIKQAEQGEGHAPALMKQLLSAREKLKVDHHCGSVRGMITELRELKTNLRAQLDRGSVRAGAELMLVNGTLETLQEVSNEQIKVFHRIEKELELLKDTVDSRLEYYRQLQHISDTVAPYEEDMNEETLVTTIANMEETERAIRNRLATLKSRGRYLIHLRDEASSVETQRQCIICREQFEKGVLTSCGHSYCVDCARMWWKAHRNCPTCKKRLSQNDFHQITYKPQDLTMEEESQITAKGAEGVSDPKHEAIYTGITTTTLNQIKNIDLRGSFGTKIDTLARHLLWIRDNDPGAKSVVFSQFKEFLEVLGTAFEHFRISFASFDKPNGVQSFKSEPQIECFFLHAKAQSSGLNLVNATHVFLCEPLINTAIELQAIARVHRIGQHQPTTVWMYLVEDTVEKAIYDISVERRMSHMGHAGANSTQTRRKVGIDEDQIEAANTLELEQAPLSQMLTKGPGGGEMVGNEDLWRCLFRRQPQHGRQLPTEADAEVARLLRVSAAETRQYQAESGTMGETL